MISEIHDDTSLSPAAETKNGLTEVRRQEALLITGALQRAIFNSTDFSSIATDERGVIQIFNVGAEHMLGYAAADVVNKITPADISDPQEVIARARALSVEVAAPVAPGFEALVFKASRGIEDVYELTYIRKDGSRFPAIVSVTALRDAGGAIIGYLLISADKYRAQAGRGRAEAAQSAPEGPPVLYALAVRIQHRCADDHGSVRHHHRCQQADAGAHRLHARRIDRRAVPEPLHRPGAGRGRHQTGAERKESHQLRAHPRAPGTTSRRSSPSTRPRSTTGIGGCKGSSPRHAT